MTLKTLVVFLFLVHCATVAKSCDRAEEGGDHTFSAPLGDFHTNFLWKVEQGDGTFTLVSNCSRRPLSCDDVFPGMTGTVYRISTGEYKSELVVAKVTRAGPINCEAIWSWGWDEASGFNSSGSCYLSVYYVPTSDAITCGNVTLDSDSQNILADCTIDKIYPKPNCRFFVTLRVSRNYFPSSTTTESTVSNGEDPVYYSGRCLLNSPPSYSVETGLNFFSVKFYFEQWMYEPEVLRKFATLTFVAPVATIISQSCPHKNDPNKGYVRPESNTKCKCGLVSRGFPPGIAQWTIPWRGVVSEGDADGGDATLILNSKLAVKHMEFTCNAYSKFRPQNSAGTVTENIAYGPTHITMSADPYSVSICPFSVGYHVNFICYIDEATRNPSAEVHVLINNTLEMRAYYHTKVHGVWQYRASYEPTRPGQVHARCIANNSIFPDMSATDAIEVDILESPSDRPVITIGNSGPIKSWTRFSVPLNQEQVIVCKFSGGYPAVSSVTISCTKEIVTKTPGNTGSLKIKLTKTYHTTECTCSAQHKSGCDLPTNTFNIDVQEDSSSNLPVILGASIGGVVLLGVIIALIALCICKRNKRKRQAPSVYFRHQGEAQQGPVPHAAVPTSSPDTMPAANTTVTTGSNPAPPPPAHWQGNMYSNNLSSQPQTAQPVMAPVSNGASVGSQGYGGPIQGERSLGAGESGVQPLPHHTPGYPPYVGNGAPVSGQVNPSFTTHPTSDVPVTPL